MFAQIFAASAVLAAASAIYAPTSYGPSSPAPVALYTYSGHSYSTPAPAYASAHGSYSEAPAVAQVEYSNSYGTQYAY
ncbi:hypothetical protein M8J75_012621 [Diaphorina citri]|nr:hypothetical protein M8J75_012621 [Diaphorina citri]